MIARTEDYIAPASPQFLAAENQRLKVTVENLRAINRDMIDATTYGRLLQDLAAARRLAGLVDLNQQTVADLRQTLHRLRRQTIAVENALARAIQAEPTQPFEAAGIPNPQP